MTDKYLHEYRYGYEGYECVPAKYRHLIAWPLRIFAGLYVLFVLWYLWAGAQ